MFTDLAISRSLTATLKSSQLVMPVVVNRGGLGQSMNPVRDWSGTDCEGLFFQDTLDDSDVVDPVFVAGLPTVE